MENRTPATRKPYAAPTLVHHGDAVARTLGVNGAFYEYSGWRWSWDNAQERPGFKK